MSCSQTSICFTFLFLSASLLAMSHLDFLHIQIRYFKMTLAFMYLCGLHDPSELLHSLRLVFPESSWKSSPSTSHLSTCSHAIPRIAHLGQSTLLVEDDYTHNMKQAHLSCFIIWSSSTKAYQVNPPWHITIERSDLGDCSANPQAGSAWSVAITPD